jgi:hypothetical protein
LLPVDPLADVELEDIPFAEVIEVVETDAKLKAGLDLADVLLEMLEAANRA